MILMGSLLLCKTNLLFRALRLRPRLQRGYPSVIGSPAAAKRNSTNTNWLISFHENFTKQKLFCMCY
jgi:hypothetical protein